MHPRSLASLWLLVVSLLVGTQAWAACPPGASPECIPGRGTWETTLQPRDYEGDGVVDAYYDTALDLTWLADADFAKTSGFDANGLLTFANAVAWANGLELFGGSDWRLPGVEPAHGPGFLYTHVLDGTTDVGYAMPNTGWGTANEIGHLYYVTLGNLGVLIAPGVFKPFTPDNVGPFRNLGDVTFWIDEPWAPSALMAWCFDFDNGRQGSCFRNGSASGGGDDGGLDPSGGQRVWAVHDGDLIGGAPAAVAVPLGGAGALGLLLVAAGIRRSRLSGKPA